MNLLTLHYFEEVAKELSFTRAAENLYISQQSLSQHIKRLEDYYDVKLFERKPTLRLTYAGQIFLEYARRSFQAEEQLIQEFNSIRTSQKGQIILGITPSRAPIFVPKIFSLFSQLYPNIDLSLKEAHTAELEQDLLNGDIDMLIGVIGHSSQPPSFTVVPLLTDDKIFFIASPMLLHQLGFNDEWIREKKSTGIKISEINDIPLILKPSDSRIHAQIAQAYVKLSLKPHVFLQSSNMLSLLPICTEGQAGIFLSGIVLKYISIQEQKKINSVAVFPVRDCPIESSIVLVYSKRGPLPKYFSHFIEITRDIMQEYSQE